jgi:hypothetical protein
MRVSCALLVSLSVETSQLPPDFAVSRLKEEPAQFLEPRHGYYGESVNLKRGWPRESEKAKYENVAPCSLSMTTDYV